MEEKKRKSSSGKASLRTQSKKPVKTKKKPEDEKKEPVKKERIKKESVKKEPVKKETAKKNTMKKETAKERSSAHTDTIDVPDIRRRAGTPLWAEILLWLLLAFCMILMLSNFFEIGGVIGNAISRMTFGIFGIMAQLFPFILFGCAAFLVANRGSLNAWTKVGAAFLLYLCLCTVCQLLMGPYDPTETFVDVYQMGTEWKTGGGIAGELLRKIFCPVFGTAGAWICTLVFALVNMVVLTGFSFFDRLGHTHGKTGRSRRTVQRRQMHALKKERSQLMKQRRLQMEIDQLKAENDSIEQGIDLKVREPRRMRTVSGVSWDTVLDPSLPVPGEIHEVTPRVRRVHTDDPVIPAEEEPIRVEAVKEHTDERISPSLEKMNFTIERNGTSESVREIPPFTAAKLQPLEEPKVPVQQDVPVSRMPALEETDETDVSVNADAAGWETLAASVKQEALAEPAKSTQAEHPSAKQPKSSREEQLEAVEDVAAQIAKSQQAVKREYVFPPISLLREPKGGAGGNTTREVKETAAKLQKTLSSFGVNANVTNVSCGPAVTRYELMPEMGVKVSRIVNLSDDIKLNLAAADIRIEAPIPGKAAVGIEVPNKENSAVALRELISSEEFKKAKSKLSFAVGKDIAGKVVVADIAKMPHLLIAGATGSGKSVCINTLIMSILYKADPEEVKLIMIDPKVVELSVYNGIPHLFIPVVTDPKKAAGALNWGVAEMTERYQKFAECGVRDLKGYNEKVAALKDVEGENKPTKLPQIIIIVDELADLMMVAPGEVEDSIVRLSQLARAAGIHLIIATQRPSVNVITGLIKANMPSRIAFSVTSGVDSRTIIDMNGAEKLLGKGDMLFYPQGYQKPARVQGAFVSDEEVGAVTEFLKEQCNQAGYGKEMEERISKVQQAASASMAASGGNEIDSNFVQAGKFIIEKDKASIGMLQRVFKIGFNRAARIMDQLSDAGVVGPEEGTKPRKVLMSMEEFEQYVDEYI